MFCLHILMELWANEQLLQEDPFLLVKTVPLPSPYYFPHHDTTNRHCECADCAILFGKTFSFMMHCPRAHCNAKFYDKNGLKDHLTMHVKERPFICTYKGCHGRYMTKRYLARHIDYAHVRKRIKNSLF